VEQFKIMIRMLALRSQEAGMAHHGMKVKRPKGMADIVLAASFNKSLAKGYDLEQCLGSGKLRQVKLVRAGPIFTVEYVAEEKGVFGGMFGSGRRKRKEKEKEHEDDTTESEDDDDGVEVEEVFDVHDLCECRPGQYSGDFAQHMYELRVNHREDEVEEKDRCVARRGLRRRSVVRRRSPPPPAPSRRSFSLVTTAGESVSFFARSRKERDKLVARFEVLIDSFQKKDQDLDDMLLRD
jgi:hypothetical protein